MGRVQPTPTAPPVPDNPREFDRPYEFTGTTDPRDLARALGEGKSYIVGVGATRVVTPDEQQ